MVIFYKVFFKIFKDTLDVKNTGMTAIVKSLQKSFHDKNLDFYGKSKPNKVFIFAI